MGRVELTGGHCTGAQGTLKSLPQMDKFVDKHLQIIRPRKLLGKKRASLQCLPQIDAASMAPRDVITDATWDGENLCIPNNTSTLSKLTLTESLGKGGANYRCCISLIIRSFC